ncbi:hypothetical protein PBY51_013814 [Eleginops maclovinus]|nr:hypothetical protein PBY51_013814 [Eleginops maclovinus]
MSSCYPPPSYLSLVSPHLEDGSVPVLLMEPLRGPRLLMEPLRGHGLLPFLSPVLPSPCGPLSVYECPLEPAFIQKRNERERQRVRCVNQGFARLRGHLPGRGSERRLSKVETLRAAIKYIQHLQGLVQREGGALPVGPSTST